MASAIWPRRRRSLAIWSFWVFLFFYSQIFLWLVSSFIYWLDEVQENKIEIDEKSEEEEEDVGSLAYLLNACLKSDNMASIVKLGTDWYGAVSSWQESKNDPKKKSNLMLYIFAPGEEVFNDFVLKIKSSSTASNQSASTTNSTMPVKSYNKGTTVWYHTSNLQVRSLNKNFN